MPSKKQKPEEVIGKLREAEIVLAQGASRAEACRRIGGGAKSSAAKLECLLNQKCDVEP